MSNTAGPAKPNAWQYLCYIYGGRLPDSMRDLVSNDLAGKGATRRHMLRVHGLDPSLADEISREKNAHIHEAYIARYGPRSGPSSSHDI